VETWVNHHNFGKFLPVPSNPMTATQKKYLQQLVTQVPLPPIFRVTIDLTIGSTSEEYEQERSERICQWHGTNTDIILRTKKQI